jgi:hypothetical protein
MMLKYIQPVGTTSDVALLDQPVTTNEIPNALRAGSQHKSPGIDGICLEFYVANCDTIRLDLTDLLNQMFMLKNIHPRQKHGILLCLPKLNGDNRPQGYHRM